MATSIVCFYFPIVASLGYPHGFPVYRRRPSLMETADRTDSFWIKALTFRLFDFQTQRKAQLQDLFEMTLGVLHVEPNSADESLCRQYGVHVSQSCLVEVAVEVDPIEKIHEDLEINAELGSSPAFTRLFNEALAGVRSVLQGHTAATGQLLSTPTVQSLPPMIPYAFSTNLDSLYAGEVSLGIYMLPKIGDVVSEGNVRRDGDVAANQLVSYLLAFDNNGPFLPYIDLEQEALHSLQVTGQYRAGIVALATAFELLFDDLLLSLLWEKKYDPKQAISEYFRDDKASDSRPNSITQRVTQHLQSLLGESWVEGSERIVDQWQEKIADLRNLVAHNGELPSETDVSEAIWVHDQLQKHVANCLFAQRQNYPLTAELFLGEAGFIERNEKWEPLVNMKDSLENQVRFGRYRAEVKNGILPKNKRRKPSKENSDLVCHFQDAGQVAYYLVDPDVGRMARINSIRKFPRHLREEIEKNTEIARQSISGTNVSVTLNIHPSRVPIKSPNWEPAWTTLPLFEIFPLAVERRR